MRRSPFSHSSTSAFVLKPPMYLVSVPGQVATICQFPSAILSSLKSTRGDLAIGLLAPLSHEIDRSRIHSQYTRLADKWTSPFNVREDVFDMIVDMKKPSRSEYDISDAGVRHVPTDERFVPYPGKPADGSWLDGHAGDAGEYDQDEVRALGRQLWAKHASGKSTRPI